MEQDLSEPTLWVAGIVLLLFGRRLYWLFVGLAGFALGFLLTLRFVDSGSEWIVVLAALLLGAAGSLAAVFFQKVAVSLVGFLAGVVATLWLAEAVGWDPGLWIWLVAILAGALGGFLTRGLFELALVVLSSAFGASLIGRATDWQDPQASIYVLLLAGGGIAIQLLMKRRSGSEKG